MDDRCKSLMAYHRDRLPDFSALNVVHLRQWLLTLSIFDVLSEFEVEWS